MSYASEVGADNPLVYYRLGESSGTAAADDSGNGHDGTYHGSPGLAATGLLTGDADTAVEFTAVANQRVESDTTVRGAGTIAAFALECLVDLPASGGFDSLLLVADPALVGAGTIQLSYLDGFVFFNFTGTGGFGNAAAAAGAGVHHVVGEFTGTALHIYVDGVLGADEPFVDAGAVFGAASSFGVPVVGTGSTLVDAHVIDEAAFYTHALGAYRAAVHAAVAVGDPPPPPPDGPTPALAASRLRMVSMFGSVLEAVVPDGILDLASLESVTWTKNQPTEYAFFFPKPAYDEDTLPVWGNDTRVVELQIWDCRPGVPLDTAVDQLFTWGPIVDMQTAGSDGAMHGTGKDVSTYLFVPPRYIDGPRPNRLSNPSFETGDTTDWTDGGAITATVTTDWAEEGIYALRVVSSTPFGDIHEHQTISVDGLELGRLITVVAYYKIESFTAPAYAGRGLFVVATESGTVVAQAVHKIDGTPTIGIPQRAEVTLQVPPNKTWDLDIRLYAPEGSTLWDATQAVEMDSVSTAGAEESLEHLCRLIILHVQDGAVEKSDVFITTDSGADAGPKVAKVWQWADHIACDGPIREFVERDDGIDWAMRFDPDTGERLFETFYPRRGTDYTTGDVHLLFGPGGNLADYRWQRDGMAAVTLATVLGDGDGPDREEGFYADASHIGGLTIESVSAAPTGTAVNSLLPMARAKVTGANDPPKIIEVDILDGSQGVAAGALDGITLLRALVCGDVVPLTIDDGYVQEAASLWEIVRLQFTNPTRVLTATLNRVV